MNATVAFPRGRVGKRRERRAVRKNRTGATVSFADEYATALARIAESPEAFPVVRVTSASRGARSRAGQSGGELRTRDRRAYDERPRRAASQTGQGFGCRERRELVASFPTIRRMSGSGRQDDWSRGVRSGRKRLVR